MHVIFVNYYRFEDSSGIHIFFLANEMERLGIRCTVCVPWGTNSVNTFGRPLFRIISYPAAALEALVRILTNKKEKTVVHAWTPRENVRLMSSFIAKKCSAPYIVHLEDNEEAILASHLGMPFGEIARLPWHKLFRIYPDLIHPRRYGDFLKKAAGTTCIMDSLKRFLPNRIPSLTFWPACEEEFFSLPPEPDQNMRQSLSISHETFVITYTGNVHTTNVEEVGNLYLAVKLLNEEGFKVQLLRSGSDHAAMTPEAILAGKQYAVELGNQPPDKLIRYVASADILVQPGCPDSFNDFRFPSKLPMYFASGRPVLLPPTNIGMHVRNGVECLHLNDGSPQDIASKIAMLIENPDFARKIGKNGREFARINFSWEKTALNLLQFYERILAGYSNSS